MLIVEIFLMCNGNCGENFGVDIRNLTADQIRDKARKNGWYCESTKDGSH